MAYKVDIASKLSSLLQITLEGFYMCFHWTQILLKCKWLSKVGIFFHQVSVLSLYSAAVDNNQRATSLHVCISSCHGALDDGDVWEIEQKCHFLGTTAILFVLDITEDARTDEVSFKCRKFF